MGKQMKIIALILAVCSFYAAIDSAQAHGGGGFGGHHGGGFGGGWHHGGGEFGHWHGGGNLGIYMGSPFYYPNYSYPYYNYYPPAVVTVPTAPPVYIQQTPQPSQALSPGYWYYCNSPQGYYPYIKQCTVGWQQVAPTPPPPAQ